jgi:hypothetical protein
MTPPPAQQTVIPDAAPRAGLVGFVRRRRWTLEVFFFALALLAYQGSRALVIGNATDAFHNALDVIGLEKAHGFFFESDIQGWLLDNLNVAQFLNQFYVWAHLPITAAFFIWLYRRRRWAYPFVRNAFFIANGVALAVFVVFPVAPPRMMTNEGFIDTLSLISGIDLHGGHFSGWFNPFAAVPSMHFAYALMIGVVCAVLVRNWVLKVLALAYPVLVFITIVGTANHYVLDALAGGLVMLIAFAAMALWRTARRRIAVSTAAGTDAPAT